MVSKELLNQLSKLLIGNSQTLAVAESVTAGLVTNFLSNAENATQFLQGGLTAYNLGQKTRHLHVNPISAGNVNCVSASVCEQMARGVATGFCADWGIAITGYAVPVPALGVETCFAFYSFVLHGQLIKAGRLEATPEGQERVQEEFAAYLLQEFLTILQP